MKKTLLFISLFLLFPFIVKAEEISNKALIDVTNTNILEIQERVEKGYLDYETLLKIYMDRIELYEGDYNLLISINENAIEEAVMLDKEREEQGIRSLLHGIPVIVKDNIDVYGMPTTAGSSGLLDNFPNEDAYIVSKLKEAGAIVLAKSNMSQFGFSARYSASNFGTVGNVFDNRYSAYGSSGGSAQAVALSLAPVALGTDTNSSIRMPASVAGVVGLRPTYDWDKLEGSIAYDKSRDVIGPITKNLEDNIIVQEIIDSKDYNIKVDISDLNIGVLSQFYKSMNSNVRYFSYSNSEVTSAFQNIVDYYEEVSNVHYIDDLYTSRMFDIANRTIMGASMCYDFNQYIKNTTGDVRSFQDLLNTGGYIYNLWDYNIYCNVDRRSQRENEVSALKYEFESRVLSYFDKYDLDVLIYPSTKSKNIRANMIYQDPFYNNIRNISPVIGYPAINVPGFMIDGLPYGFEILAKPGKEDVIYSVANSYLTNNDINFVPSNYKNHYDISKNALKLIEIYEMPILESNYISSSDYLNYIEILEEIETYLKNYDGDEEVEEMLLNSFIKNYENISFNLGEHSDDPALVFSLISTYLIVISTILISLKKHFKNIKKEVE